MFFTSERQNLSFVSNTLQVVYEKKDKKYRLSVPRGDFTESMLCEYSRARKYSVRIIELSSTLRRLHVGLRLSALPVGR
jgi:hypothetical protein